MADVSANGRDLLIWIIVFTIVCVFVLALRFWAARIAKRRPSLDDFFVCFAFANTLALTGTAIWGIANGLGAHTGTLSVYQIGVQFKLILSAGITWLLATVFLKLSITSLYIRIFTTKAFRTRARIVQGFVAAYGVAFLCVFMTNCYPISQQWDPVPGGWCRDLKVEELTSVVLNMFLDTLVLILPLPPLWGLQLATRKKVTLSCLFSIGLTTVGISAWRLPATLDSAANPDFVYGFTTIALISFLELWLGHIVACVPTLAPLLNKYVIPALSKLSTGSNKPSDVRLGNMDNTIGGRRPRGQAYQRFDDEGFPILSSAQAHCAADGAPLDVVGERRTSHQNQNQIHVQQDVDVTYTRSE